MTELLNAPEPDDPEAYGGRPHEVQVSRESTVGGVRVRFGDTWRVIFIGAATLALGLGALAALWLLWRPLALLVLGIVVAQALAPVVEFFQRALPRLAAILLVYLTLILIAAAVIYLVVPTLVAQARAAAAQAPDLLRLLEAWLADRNLWPGGGLSTFYDRLAGMGPALLRLPLAIASTVIEMVLVVFVSLYWLIQAPAIHRFALSLLPVDRQQRFADLTYEMGRAMGGYLRGTAINGAILGVTTFIGLSVIGVHYPLVLGLIAALFEFVPVFGATISAILMVLVALSQSLHLALIALALAVVLHQTENHILVPNIMHSQTDISPLLAVLAVVAGTTLGGLLGAVISIPLASALQVLVKEVVAPAIRRRTGAAPGGEAGGA